MIPVIKLSKLETMTGSWRQTKLFLENCRNFLSLHFHQQQICAINAKFNYEKEVEWDFIRQK